ncbi:MAG: PfkB family carbohydrate kinase [Planctomycetaceae bacterium]|jgi:sugar/nucleoside kinase (ribokinase family)|nr:PfkB family carbohydrate kinase [Planctomycetaceae bacterium]
MSLLVVGSVAYDNIETPTERRDDVLGGSALHFSFAATFFSPVQLVAVVGGDWRKEDTQLLESRGVDTTGLEVQPNGKTFRWTGRYRENMDDRDTLETQLNVLGDFEPKLPETYRRSQFVFLANGSTKTQLKVLEQTQGADLVVADTMNLWINVERDLLLELLQKIDGLMLNDSEAKQLTGEINTLTAARKVLELGPKFVVIKKGEHGAIFISQYDIYLIPAFPTEQLVEPTGAGDTFAGGMMGYIAQQGKSDGETIRQAIAYGAIVASFQVEGFGAERLLQISKADIDERLEKFRRMIGF